MFGQFFDEDNEENDELSEDDTSIFAAILEQKFDLLESYLEAGGDVNILDEKGRSLLLVLLSLEEGYPKDLAMALLDRDCSVEGTTVIGDEENEPTTFNATILHAAYINRHNDRNCEVLRRLLECLDVDLNACCDFAPVSSNALFSYIRYPNPLSFRSYIDGYILERATIIHLLALDGQLALLKKVVETGRADIKARASLVHNKHLETPDNILHENENARVGILKTVWACREGVDIYKITDVSALHLAARNGHHHLYRYLASQNPDSCSFLDSDDQTPRDYLLASLSDTKELVARGYKHPGRTYDFLSGEYDSDSESDDDYEYKPDLADIEDMQVEQLPPRQSVVSQFRGVHFYAGMFDRSARKRNVTLQKLQLQGLAPIGMHCAASHAAAGESYAVENVDAIDPKQPINQKALTELNQARLAKDAKLRQASLVIVAKLQTLCDTGAVRQCLGTTRENFDCRLDELMQRYVNSYASLTSDMAKANSHRLDGRASDKSRTKWELLQSLGCDKLPIVSTSDESRWALEYATALVNYDKQDTFLPRDKEVTPLMPEYNENGRPKHPYLGLVYVSLHPVQDLSEQSSSHIPTLFAKGRIDTSAGPGGHAMSGYVRARERAFFAYVPKEEVKYFALVRLPNFDKPYPVYYQQKYGLSEKQFNKFKSELEKHGQITNVTTGQRRNQKEYDRTTVKIIQYVVEHQQHALHAQANRIARDNRQKVVYLDPNGAEHEKMPDIKDFIQRRTQPGGRG